MNAPTRREKLRQLTYNEIKERARAQLAAQGPQGISLRAIAREMEMAPAALYRYFPSLTELGQALVVDLYDELANVLKSAVDDVSATDLGRRIGATCRAFRSWANAHRNEFALVFGGAYTGIEPPANHQHPEVRAAALRFAAVFGEIFNDMWRNGPFTVPDERDLPPTLRAQLASETFGSTDELPSAGRYVFWSCWIWLYGYVAAEVFGHLPATLGDDTDAMFDAQMHEVAARLGIKKRHRPA